MTDLDTIDEVILIARGKYSTLRSEQKKELERLRLVCTEFQSVPAAILKNLQSPNSAERIVEMIKDARATLDDLEKSAVNMDAMQAKLNEIRQIAWAK